MSHVQYLGNFGGTINPNITSDIFKDILRNAGEVLDLYRRGTVANCDCFNETFNTADPDCPTCLGTGTIGGYEEEPYASFLGIVQFDSARGRDQGNQQRIYTIAGPLDDLNAIVYAEPKWFEMIHNEDLLVYKPKGSSTGYELRITSKLARIGTNNNMVFFVMNVNKNPKPLRMGATDIKDQM